MAVTAGSFERLANSKIDLGPGQKRRTGAPEARGEVKIKLAVKDTKSKAKIELGDFNSRRIDFFARIPGQPASLCNAVASSVYTASSRR